MKRLLLFLTIALSAPVRGQIPIVSSGATGNAISTGGAYVQNFNSLPSSGTNPWTNNSTLSGWYAATGTGEPNTDYTSITSSSPNIGGNPAGTLYSMPQHFDNNTPASGFRALGFAPSGTTGNGHAALRFVNNTGAILTGLTVSYEIRWGYSQDTGVDSFDLIAGGSGYATPPTVTVSPSPTGANATATSTTNAGLNVNGITKTASGSGYTSPPSVTFDSASGTNASARAIMKLVSSSNSVTLSAKTFNAGSGTLAGFSSAGWTTVASVTNANTTTASVPDDWNYVTQTLTNLNIAPGQEIWLDWQFKKEGSTGSSVAALDNVRVYDFGKGDPAILTQPAPQAVILGNSAKLSVKASGSSTLFYQWRKNGSNISGATSSTYSLASAQPSDAGSYDVAITSGGNAAISVPVAVQVFSRASVRGPAASGASVSSPAASYTQDAALGDITVTNTSAYSNKYDLYLPDTPVVAGTRPAVVVIHGGGGNDGDKADTREVQACIEFASHGYAALSINYKKSFKTNSSGSWSTAWPQNIKDAKTAVRWLRANAASYGIDPNRIGAIGFSWGGNEAAMLALTEGDISLDPTAEDGLGAFSSKVQCAANFYGAVQIPDYHNMNQFSGNGVPGSIGTMDYTAGANNYLAASPASRTSSTAAPLLLSHGDADLEVMPTQNFALKAALLNAGAAVQGVSLQAGGLHSYSLYDTVHNLVPGTVTDVRAETLGFFDKYLQPFLPSITSPATVSGGVGSTFTYQIRANHSPVLYTATGLPPGVTLDANTGVISGNLSVTKGGVPVTITATGPAGTATAILNLVSTDVITVTSTVEGTTPESLGYNLGHFMLSGDAADWFRYSGVKAARVFISASELQGATSPGKSKVTSLATFNSNILSTRSAGLGSSVYIKWSDYNYNYVSTNGSNDINYKDAFGALNGLGVDILANITCSPGTFPLSGATDYPGQWEIWQHYYAQAYLLSRDYGVHRFSMFNEPNNWSGETEADWLLRLRVCSDAIQAAVTDVNTAFSKSLVTQIYAPNTANGESKYNNGSDTWGYDAVSNRHLKLNGTTDPNWLLFHFYNYQKYSMLTNDGGGLTGYIEDIDLLAGYITADMPGETRFPLVLTEFNVRTGANYDGSSATQDDSTDAVALGANCVALTQRVADQLYLFKFGQTEDLTSPYGLAKNGTHYVDNISSACNYGGATRAAEVYRLFNKAARGGRSRFTSAATSGAASSTTSGLWRLVTRDPEKGNYQIFLANKKTSAIPLSLDLSAWTTPDGTPVVTEEVSATCRGGVSQLSNVKDGQAFLGSIPAESVWLVTVPSTAATLTQTVATEDTQVADGANSTTTGGGTANMVVRADGTVDGRKAVLIKIPIPAGPAADFQAILLDVGAAATAGSSPIQAHVYGLTTDSWSEGSSTWSSLSAVLKQGVPAGNQIAQNTALNTGVTPAAKMLGQLVVNSTNNSRRLLEVTDFVKSRGGAYASFLIVQEHRWNYSAELTTVRTTGDTQSAGMIIASRENPGAGPRLLAVRTGAVTAPPVVLSNPADQFVNLGGTVNLAIKVDASGPFTIQWKKDGVVIAGATGPSLSIAPALLTQAGAYTAEVTNAAGTATSGAASVTINAAPILATALKNTTVYVGDTVTLSATFTASPPPVYQWTRDGVPISGAVDSIYSFTPTATTESGTYAVTATNSYGSASSSAVVTVNATPTSFINISNTVFSYSQNFDALEKSGTYSVKTIGGNVYAPWTDGGAGFLGWYAATDRAFSGYRTVNNSSSSDINIPVTTDQSGLMSMGSASSSIDRGFGGIPWADNRIYHGLRLRNGTGKTLTGCTVAFAVEQFTATTAAKNDTAITLATQVGASGLKTGTWTTQAAYAPLVTVPSTYSRINGASNANRSAKSVTLTGISVPPGADIWLRWTVSSTSSEPVALAVDDVLINGAQVVNNPQTISFSLSQNTVTYGDPAPTVTASSTSSLPVAVTSSDSAVAQVGANNALILVGPGAVTLTANQPGDTTWAPAAPVQQVLIVNPAGPTFATTFPGQAATSDLDGDGIKALIEYAIGGSSSGDDSGKLPLALRQGGFFTLTVVERINDPALTISAEASADPGFAPPLLPGPVRSEAADQSGVPAGFKRAVYTLPAGGIEKRFMRLKAALLP